MSKRKQVLQGAHALTKALIQRARDAHEAADIAALQSSQQTFEDEVLEAIQHIDFDSVKIFLDFVRGEEIPEIPPLGTGRIAKRDKIVHYAQRCVTALCVLSNGLKSAETLEEGKAHVNAFVESMTDPLRYLYPRATVYLLQYHRSGTLNPELLKEPKMPKERRGGSPTRKKAGS